MHPRNTVPNTVSAEQLAFYNETPFLFPPFRFSDGFLLHLFAVLFAPHGFAVANGGNGEIHVRHHDDSLLLCVLKEIDSLFELLSLSKTFDRRLNGHDTSENGLGGR